MMSDETVVLLGEVAGDVGVEGGDSRIARVGLIMIFLRGSVCDLRFVLTSFRAE